MSQELIEMILVDGADRMDGAVVNARREFSGVRTGRASSALVERIMVSAYGVQMTLQELAGFSIPEARQLLITPHDPANIAAVERAIQMAQLGLIPSNDGRVIRLSFPPLTEDRRRELARLVGGMAEDSKGRIRGVRRQTRKDLNELEKQGGVSSDDIERACDRLDELTHAHEDRIDEAQAQKREELLEV